MFRLSQYMQELICGRRLRARKPPGPVVIWNLVRRCNLNCIHCYSLSCDKDFPGELSTAEACAVMDDLKAFGVPVLILSGGEPCSARTSSRSPSAPRRWGSTSACRPTAR